MTFLRMPISKETTIRLEFRNPISEPFAFSQLRRHKKSTKKVLLECVRGNAMKNQNVLKTTSQMSFFPEATSYSVYSNMFIK
jgi:hypothetical protein